MASLKAFLPALAKILRTTPDALYTRQRALQTMDILEYREGRGPGSGSPLHQESVAALLISLLGADTLSDTDDRIAALCRCADADGTTLMNAVGAVLTIPLKNADDEVTIRVERNVGAEVTVRTSRKHTRRFLIADADRLDARPIAITAEMGPVIVAQIAKAFLISFKENRE